VLLLVFNVPETEEIAFILVFNKKHKEKSKGSPLSSMSFSNSRSKTLFILWALSLFKAVTTYPGSIMTPSLAITIFKTIKPQMVPLPVLLVFKSKFKIKSFA